ncbi:hypothetical protein [Tenacibaculum sp. 190524A05c]|uniref:hypothetical protein n=1 Tax=Tenacibaculum platacis TaxID=3137852 RepID=UPI0032B2BA02
MKTTIQNLGKPLHKEELKSIKGSDLFLSEYCTEDCFKTGGSCVDGVCINF